MILKCGARAQETRGGTLGIKGYPPSLVQRVRDRLRFDVIDWPTQKGTRPAVTGNFVLRLPERHVKPSTKTWDGRYLVVGCPSGEVAIVDFDPLDP